MFYITFSVLYNIQCFIQNLMFYTVFNILYYIYYTYNHVRQLYTFSFLSSTENFHICRRLVGVITKKDVLRHIAELKDEDPSIILFS